MSEDNSNEIENHNQCECAVVHPHGQIQQAKDCWCKIYRSFGEKIELEAINLNHIAEDIYCYTLKIGQKMNLQQNPFISRKLKQNIFGPAIMFRKGNDLTLEKAKTILQS
jgi:hypothetical protein